MRLALYLTSLLVFVWLVIGIRSGPELLWLGVLCVQVAVIRRIRSTDVAVLIVALSVGFQVFFGLVFASV